MRVAFAGTPAFARVALEHVQTRGFEIALVLTQPDRPAGRGMKLAASPVKSFALQHGIDVVQPRGLRQDGKYADDARITRSHIEAARADVLVVAAYGLIVPRWLLELPRLGCTNVHASLLPRWRGAAPVQRAIEAGDERTGVTIMQMDDGLDTGDILLTAAVDIERGDTAGSLTERLATLGARLLVEVLELAAAGGLSPTPQPAEGTSYAHKIGKQEAAIDWSLDAAAIERRVRAFDPFPGASFMLGGETIKLWRSVVLPAQGSRPAAPSTVLDVNVDAGGGIAVACGAGTALALQCLQRPGGRRMQASEFLGGRPLERGTLLAA